jgi:hypothetical protein
LRRCHFITKLAPFEVDPLFALPVFWGLPGLELPPNPWLQFHLETLAAHFERKHKMSQNLDSASPKSASSYAVPHVTGAPLSPRSTTSLLAANPHIPEGTMHQIAASLLWTIEECESAHNTEVWELREKLLHLEELVGDEDSEEPPKGYVRNNGKVPNFNIPMDNGLYLPAKFIKPHSGDYTKTFGLTGKELSTEAPYSMEIYASPNIRLNEVPELLPL